MRDGARKTLFIIKGVFLCPSKSNAAMKEKAKDTREYSRKYAGGFYESITPRMLKGLIAIGAEQLAEP